MPNYSLVVNSKFRPFSFERYIQPYQIYGQAYREQQDALSELEMRSSVWDGLTEGSERAHRMYTDYAKALDEAADDLSKYGLNPTSRQAMLNMRTRYGKEITPIENAYTRRAKQMEEQTKAMLANPTLMVSRRASDTNLDEYLANPALDYQSYNGALITKQVADQASHLAKELRDYGNGKRLDSFTKTFLQEHGFTKDEVLEAINNPRSGSPVLRAIADSVIRASGITEDWADNALAKANYYANMGLWSAVGETAAAHYEDKAASYAAQLANSKSLARYSKTLEGSGGDSDRLSMYDVSPTSYYSRDEVTKANDTLAKQLGKWRRKGYFDDSGNLTDEGRRALTDTYTLGARGKSHQDTEFQKWAKDKDRIMSPYAGVSHGQGRPYQYLENYYKRTKAAIDNGQLATGTANFQVYRQRLEGDDRKLIAANIYNIIGDGLIYEAGKLVDGTITKGKGYTAEQFANEIGGYKVDDTNSSSNILYLVNSPVTGKQGQQLIELINGKKFLIPDGEQFFGTDTYANLVDANTRVRNAASRAEVATNLNRANSYMASPLTVVKGTDIKPNEGVTTIDLINLLEEEEK